MFLFKNELYHRKNMAKRAGGHPKDANGRFIPPLVPLPPSAAVLLSGRVSKTKTPIALPFIGGSSSKRKSSQPKGLRPSEPEVLVASQPRAKNPSQPKAKHPSQPKAKNTSLPKSKSTTLTKALCKLSIPLRILINVFQAQR